MTTLAVASVSAEHMAVQKRRTIAQVVPTEGIEDRCLTIRVDLAGTMLCTTSQPLHFTENESANAHEPWNSPIMDEHPGPPFSHRVNGAVSGLFRASKNQNHYPSIDKWEVQL